MYKSVFYPFVKEATKKKKTTVTEMTWKGQKQLKKNFFLIFAFHLWFNRIIYEKRKETERKVLLQKIETNSTPEKLKSGVSCNQHRGVFTL